MDEHSRQSAVCAHCGTRDGPPEDEHFCIASIFDWMQSEDGREVREYGELLEFMERFGL